MQIRVYRLTPRPPPQTTTDIGFDPLRLSANGIRENWALSELKHGRLAMIAFLAFVVQVRSSSRSRPRALSACFLTC